MTTGHRGVRPAPNRLGAGPSKPSTCELQPFDRALLEWIVVWAPYGGAPEDETFPEFGLSDRQLADRVALLVSDRHAGGLSVEADRILVSRVRKALLSKASPPHPARTTAAMTLVRTSTTECSPTPASTFESPKPECPGDLAARSDVEPHSGANAAYKPTCCMHVQAQ